MQCIVAVNAGSSSIKLSIFSYAASENSLQKIADAQISDMGQPVALLRAATPSEPETSKQIEGGDRAATITILMDWLTQQTTGKDNSILGIGHRVVHGGANNFNSQIITDSVERELKALQSYDPEHLPMSLELITATKQHFPATPQVVSFDTAFFHGMPRIAQIIPLPRQYEAQGVRRYGFHGLSYTYLLSALAESQGAERAGGRVIIAHLGSGSSLAAIHDGKPIDTTMSFTPASGVMMSRRAGDLDPGIAWYLQRQAGVDAEAFNRLVNAESGLLGVSGLSGDMYTLLQAEATNAQAREAVELYCYQVKKAIGALTASLGGLDTLVFSGGIGEQSAVIRARICDGLQHLGIHISNDRNDNQSPTISADDAAVAVFVLATDENKVIAKEVERVIAPANEG